MSATDATADSLVGTSLSVSLTVADIEKSLAWYRDVMGFSVTQRHDRGGQLRAVSLRAGTVAVLIGQDDGAKGTDRVKGEGFSMRITTAQDIDAVVDRIKAAGGVLDAEPMDTPFGARVFRLRDPDGFKYVVSTDVKPGS